ncbi:hypothetical protein HZZ13_14470 [Bradyrhizobium sp. CNPSo 4010]|uniref:Uncharacterized protein n=1 Tax=Bradyrhizobium agreste TaxID=2751811 RepID=A0ABS0PP85_9BRAD|nr:hypothetical protein [Bradyrhizobium agreste]MBH5398978.1 hypothetical protein [Bradyrhizobium agreste]
MLVFAMLAIIGPTPGRCSKHATAVSTEASFLIRWSIQEIRRIAMKLAQPRISHAHILAWSSWLRAHQANARKAHLRHKIARVMLVHGNEAPLRQLEHFFEALDD